MSDTRKGAVADSTVEVLRPLARMHLSARQGFGDFVALAKLAFVQEAVDHIRASGETPTDSRIAVETGLYRAEVRAIRQQRRNAPLPFRRGRARAERVLSGWWNDPKFQDRDGRPLPLKLRGEAPSFSSLVECYESSRPQPIMEELLRAKAVRKGADGTFQAIRRTCVDIKWAPEKLGDLALQARTLLAALLENLNDSEREPQLTRFFQSGPIDPLQARILSRDLRADGLHFLESASDRLSRKLYAAHASSQQGPPRQFSVAVQVIETPAEGGELKDPPRRKRRAGRAATTAPIRE